MYERTGAPAETATYGAAEQPRKGFFTDTTLCIGCKACEVACKEWNQLPADGYDFTAQSYDNTGELNGTTWRHVTFVEQLVPQESPAAEHRDVIMPGGVGGRWLMESDVCKHCTHAACLDVCPTGALVRTEFGTVIVQEDVCNGCGYCVPACPFGVIDKRETDGHAGKCTLCYDRLKNDETPACAKACPTESIQFGDLDELRTKADARLEKVLRVVELPRRVAVPARPGRRDRRRRRVLLAARQAGSVRFAAGSVRHHARSSEDLAQCRVRCARRARRYGAAFRRSAVVSDGASYYGRPIVKPHVWTPLIPLYFWVGGTTGAAAAHGAIERLRGNDAMADVQKRVALAGLVISPVLLVFDLGVPARFLNMLRVLKVTSPMSVGSWILVSLGGVVFASNAADWIGARRTGRALEIPAAILGPCLTAYTAALIANTATPVWHEAYAELPFVFAAGGIAGAGACGAAFCAPERARSRASHDDGGHDRRARRDAADGTHAWARCSPSHTAKAARER